MAKKQIHQLSIRLPLTAYNEAKEAVDNNQYKSIAEYYLKKVERCNKLELEVIELRKSVTVLQDKNFRLQDSIIDVLSKFNDFMSRSKN